MFQHFPAFAGGGAGYQDMVLETFGYPQTEASQYRVCDLRVLRAGAGVPTVAARMPYAPVYEMEWVEKEVLWACVWNGVSEGGSPMSLSMKWSEWRRFSYEPVYEMEWVKEVLLWACLWDGVREGSSPMNIPITVKKNCSFIKQKFQQLFGGYSENIRH